MTANAPVANIEAARNRLAAKRRGDALNTFQVLQRSVRYQAKTFDVQEVLAQLPDGREHAFDLVDHRDSVILIPLMEDGNIAFVQQYRLGPQTQLLELPAGVLDPGESPETGGQRELREETGFAAKQLELLGSFYLAPGYSSEKSTAFLATGLYSSPLAPDAEEFLELKAFSPGEIYDLALQGSFQDAKTLAALLLARPRLLG